jgi:8-oxo-dGTP pyrophosphatase MutT (NUDIX family)
MVERDRTELLWEAALPETNPTSAASAERRATDDPLVFLIPEAHLPDGFADRVERGEFTPAPPRAAATVVLMRDGPAGPQVLLLRRHRRSGFAADAWVFPGGVVDAADRDERIVPRLDGPPSEVWAASLGLPDRTEAAAYVVAVIREAFEETGILLARDRSGVHVAGAEEPWVRIARHALLAEKTALSDVAADHDLRLCGDAVAYLAHWITPEPEPRRYDTRFFLAQVPPDARCDVHAAEMTDDVWLTAREAVARFERGEMKMLPPTVHTLRRLSAYASADDAFAAVAAAPVPPILPVMRRHAEGVAIELPREARE